MIIFISVLCLFAKESYAVCNQSETCELNLNISWWQIPPYIYQDDAGKMMGVFPSLLQSMVKSCCGECTKITYGMQWDSESDMLNNSVNVTAIHFPLYGTMQQIQKLKKPYIPMIESPGIMYFTDDDKSMASMSGVLLTSVSNAWPVMCFILIGSIVSGILIWALDCYTNPDQFPVSFFQGSWQGLWWALVSMTTVGYGDRAPKSFSARMFAFIWVLIGLVIIAVFNGVMTAQLTSFSVSSNSIFQGEQIAVVSGTEEYKYSATVNANVSGVTDVDELLKKLKNDESIKGALLDSYVAGYHNKLFSPQNKVRVSQVIEHIYAYGMVLTGRYSKLPMKKCFFQYMSLNENQINQIILNLTKTIQNSGNSISQEKSSNIFDPTSKWFTELLVVCGSLIILVSIFGIIWQYKKDSKIKKLKVDMPPESTIEELLKRQCLELESAMKEEVDRFYEIWNRKKNQIYDMTFFATSYNHDLSGFTKIFL